MARTRLKILMVATVLPALAICWRLWSFQIDPANHQAFRVRAESAKLKTLQPVRGAIVDRHGQILAESRSGFDLHFVYGELNPRHIVLEVVCEELSRLGEFPSPEQLSRILSESIDLSMLGSQDKTDPPAGTEWTLMVDSIPSAAAERIRHRLGSRKFYRNNFQLKPAPESSIPGYGLWFLPGPFFRQELTLSRLASLVDRYSMADLEERLARGLAEIETMVRRDVRSDHQSGSDPIFARKKGRNSRRLFYSRGHLLAPNISLEAVSRIEYHPELFPGILLEDSSRRVYPAGPVFGPITGHLRQLNKKDIILLSDTGRLLNNYSGIASKEAFSVIRQGALRRDDLVGHDGLEKTYDASLRGEYGMRLQQVGKNGRGGRLLTSLPSSRGKNLRLSIDGKLQEALYRQLWAECAHHGHGAASAAVMEIPSGALLASTAYPSYDPNRIRESAYHKEMNANHGDMTSDWLLDRPRSKALYPGSIFKIVTTIAALENGKDWEGMVDPLRKYECLVGDQRPFSMNCSSRYGHGHINLFEGFRASCNNYFYYLAAKHLAPENLEHWARGLGCGEPTGVDLPALGRGYDGGFLEKSKSVSGERGLCMYGIGQVQVQMTPLQALRMVGAVATGLKVAPRPWLVAPNPPQQITTVNPRTAEVIQECMKQVVSDPDGTVHGKFGLDSFNFAAKTGTAQYQANMLRYHSWLVGYGPLPDPSIAFVVVCEKSRLGGGDACAPIVRELMEYLAGKDPRFYRDPSSTPAPEDDR